MSGNASKSCIAFDLDGTLVDTAPDLAGAMNAVLAHFGRSFVDPEQVRDMVGRGARRTIEKGLELTGGGTEAMLDEGVPIFLDHYADHICDGSRPWEGTNEVLDALAGHAVLAVCTNKPLHLAKALVEALGWTSRFQAVLGGDSLEVRKPDPRHLLETIRMAGADPARSAYVGDSSADSEAARGAGIPFVLCRFGYLDLTPQELGADAEIDSWSDLPDALRACAPAIWSSDAAPA